MKKILQILCLCLVTFITKAQGVQSEPQVFVGTAVVDHKSDDSEGLHLQMQVGMFMDSAVNTGNFATGFPYGILYISDTFVTGGFEVSKGYYANRINIKWQLGNNQNDIEKIDIYRKELGIDTQLQFIASVSKEVFEFDDTQIQGGVLYEYVVKAVGVSEIEEEYTTFVKGVGFRNPTATVSGSINFDGGSPVQDVIVFAQANGAENNSGGSSLKFTDSSVYIDNIEDEISTNQLTLQTWVTSFGGIMSLNNNENQIQLIAGKFVENSVHSIQLKVILNNQPESVTLRDSYPTGELDKEGNDVFKNISSLTDVSFIHVSAVLEQGSPPKFYLNGREITSDYIGGVSGSARIPATDTEEAIAAVLKPSFTSSLNGGNYTIQSTIDKVILGQGYNTPGYTGYLDEVRIWQRALSSEDIRRDYRRYIAGNETDLSIYLRMDENAGTNVYDFSRKGFRQNKNDGYFVQNATNGVTFSKTTPSAKQLGVFGVTDENGSYTISSISYSGTGESFKVTPSFGVHKFEPASQSLFLGAEASVVNQLNFKDVSAFNFEGLVIYNVQNVFDPEKENLQESGSNEKYSNIEDIGLYNEYRVTENGTTKKVPKGQYYYEGGNVNEDPTKDNYIGGNFKKYTKIPLKGAYIYIDGNIVINDDNQPEESDEKGEFSIKVPIGKHKIEVRKNNHTFVHNGYFPANGTHTFVEDKIEKTVFVDNTRITLVGRIVGGRKEFIKPIGFGANGDFTHTNYEDTNDEEVETISSKNNIGQASFTLEAIEDEKNVKGSVTITTNAETGEYAQELIPYLYKIDEDNIKSLNNQKSANNADGIIIRKDPVKELELSTVPDLDFIIHTTIEGKEIHSKKFHFIKSFRYDSDVTLNLITQEYEKEITIGSDTYNVSNLEKPLYIQKTDYSMVFEVSQKYINKDKEIDDPLNPLKKIYNITKEYYNDGSFRIDNKLAFNKSPKQEEVITFEEQNGVEQYLYTFKASYPNITLSDYTDNNKTDIDISYILANDEQIGINKEDDFKPKGIIKGSLEPEGKTYVTVAPEVPDIILRDPPGSNSFASIEKGTKISFTETYNSSEEGSFGEGVYVSVGPTFSSVAGSPFFGLETEIKYVGDADTKFSKSQQINQDGSTTSTYEFKTKISTSNAPDKVGAGADLYIGNAKNQYYGTSIQMKINTNEPTNDNGTIEHLKIEVLRDDTPVDIYLSYQEDILNATQPTNTFFIYSQDEILNKTNGVIKRLENKALTAPDDVVETSTADPLDEDAIYTKSFYNEQIKLWRLIIQENERSKYLALNDRETLKDNLIGQNYLRGLNNTLQIAEIEDLPFILQKKYSYPEFNQNLAELNNLFLENFESNISIDSGAGEYTSSVTSSVIISKSFSKTIDMSVDFIAQAGALVNNVGVVRSLTGTSSKVEKTGFNTDSDITTSISYTLKDNDQDNFYALDIVNLFDGYGPIFITTGGASSCPYEGLTESHFYDHDNYHKDIVGEGKMALNDATTQVYVPSIEAVGVGGGVRSNIPENEGAVFNLELKNMSSTKATLEHTLYLDEQSLKGAISNIDQNGIRVSIPYNDPVIIPLVITKNPALEEVNYENITVYLGNPCN